MRAPGLVVRQHVKEDELGPHSFRHLLTERGPFASIYFDDSHDTEDPTARLEATCRDVVRQLGMQGAEPGLISVSRRAILDARPPVGRKRRGLITTAQAVLVDEQLPWDESSTIVRVSALPYVLPIVEHSLDAPIYAVVAVDHVGADISVHQGGAVATETVQAGGYPVHKAVRADKQEYGEAQQRVDEMVRRNIKAVAHRVTALVDDAKAQVVFVTGEIRSRNDLISALPERIAQRAVGLEVGARGTANDTEVRAAIEAVFQSRRLLAIDAAAKQFVSERARASGLAVEGLGQVCAALREGAAATLIIGDVRGRTVVADDRLNTIAPNADVLSELGAAPTHTWRADEALPVMAVLTDAEIVCAGERLDPLDGVAVLRRYPTAA
jgi:peptide chain release factor subunit 1